MSKMNEVTIRGIVGGGKVSPKKTFSTAKNGEQQPVMLFTLLYNDNTWVDDEGHRQYNRKYLKVFLSRNKHGEALFNNITIGRQIEVTGVVNADIYESKSNGETKYLPSLVMSNANIQFLDLPLSKQIKNLIDIIKTTKLVKEDKLSCTLQELQNEVNTYIKTELTPAIPKKEEKQLSFKF